MIKKGAFALCNRPIVRHNGVQDLERAYFRICSPIGLPQYSQRFFFREHCSQTFLAGLPSSALQIEHSFLLGPPQA
jgi:hypothetical protein